MNALRQTILLLLAFALGSLLTQGMIRHNSASSPAAVSPDASKADQTASQKESVGRDPKEAFAPFTGNAEEMLAQCSASNDYYETTYFLMRNLEGASAERLASLAAGLGAFPLNKA